MPRHGRLRDLAAGTPRGTVRLRLTALYCALFLPLGVALVVITVFVTFFSLHPAPLRPVDRLHGHDAALVHTPPNGAGVTTVSPPHDLHVGSLNLDVHQFLLGSAITLLVMIGIAVLLGWLLAGRVLRPLRTITDTTQSISERDLHQRLALAGPRDELTELGDTIDGLLERLEGAFDSQRRFVANASHELRTPLTVDRATLQVALADPNVTLVTLQSACEQVLEAGREQERLLDALLTLARSQRGLDHLEPVDLAAVTREVLHAHEQAVAARGLHVETSLEGACIAGDARLLYQLVANLVDNAVRHNVTGGNINVTLATSIDGSMLSVTNTGPPIASDQVSRLLQPFQRGIPDRMANASGFGLGLSIVADVVHAHRAHLEVRPLSSGGLAIAVSFPVDTPDESNDEQQSS